MSQKLEEVKIAFELLQETLEAAYQEALHEWSTSNAMWVTDREWYEAGSRRLGAVGGVRRKVQELAEQLAEEAAKTVGPEHLKKALVSETGSDVDRVAEAEKLAEFASQWHWGPRFVKMVYGMLHGLPPLSVFARDGRACTSWEMYCVALLKVLTANYPHALDASDAVQLVGEMLKEVLQPVEYERLKSGEMRWESNVRNARYALVKFGYMSAESGVGRWEITEMGMHLLLKIVEAQTKA